MCKSWKYDRDCMTAVTYRGITARKIVFGRTAVAGMLGGRIQLVTIVSGMLSPYFLPFLIFTFCFPGRLSRDISSTRR